MPNTSVYPLTVNMTAVDAAFVLVSNTASFASCLGCIVIITIYYAYKEIRTTSRLLLVLISLSNLFVCFSTLLQTGTYINNLMFPKQTSYFCRGSAALLVFSQTSSALWTVAITFYLLLCVSCRRVTLANRILFLFHIVCWGVPVLLTSAGEISGVYGYDITDILRYKHPTPCWLSDRVKNPLPWYLMTVEGWIMATFVAVSLMYLILTWTVVRQRNKGKVLAGDDVIQELAIQTANEQLRFIPAIYVCTRIWGTAYFLFTRYPEDRHLRAFDWLMIIKAIGDNSQGLANAIFFCLATKQIRKIMSKKLGCVVSCLCGWCRKHRLAAQDRWMKVPSIVRIRRGKLAQKRPKNLDGSDLDLTGISLDLPTMILEGGEEEVIFEK
ncbi:G-protein coupled receptor 157-like [Physella acuta]|uniref:G-protein coupled receptor 157-like n=1 Tax=Physella acuta TaxID=109671 RepID=UPI0027DE0467|nr:G-protein coupled receptor 157-like [Physella acuta]